MYATTTPGIDPTQSKPFIAVWSLFNLLACAGFTALAIIGLFARRRNAVLLSFEAAFALTTGMNTILTWTGTVGRVPTPFTPCLISGTFSAALALAPAASATALVTKAWAHIMMVNHPRTVAYRWMASTALLAAFPWIVSLPFLVATLVIAVRDPSTIARTSAAYCAFTYPEVTNSVIILSLVCEAIALILAAWTAVVIGLTRWRVRRGGVNEFRLNSVYYPLVLRTLLFSVLLVAGLGANLASVMTSWSNPGPDVAISFIYLLAVFIFASDPSTIRIVRGQSESSLTSASERSRSRSRTRPAASTLIFSQTPDVAVSALDFELKTVGVVPAEVPDRSHKSSIV